MSQYTRLTADLANPNSPATKIARLVGRDRLVLDVGCAHGYLAEVLHAQGCRVIGIERDPDDAERARAHCEQVIVADVETPTWVDQLTARSFDVVVFSDVLEHLRDPASVLRRVRTLLVPDSGFLVASVPNVAHASVRLELLLGSFRPEPLGILDATHLHFFTRDTLHDLLASCDLAVESWDCTTNDLSEGIIADYLRRADIPLTPALRRSFDAFDATAYQFIITARPARGPIASLGRPLRKPLDVVHDGPQTPPQDQRQGGTGPYRVLQVVHQFVPRFTAGTEIYCADLSAALARRGHTVRVLSGAPHGDTAGTGVYFNDGEAIGVDRIRATRPYRWLGSVASFFDRFDNPEARPAIESLLDRMQPDVVHVQHLLYLSAELIAACRRRGIPVVVMLNDYWFMCHRVRLERLDGALCDGPARGWNCCQCLNTPPLVRSHLNPIAVGANVYRYRYLMRRLLQADRILSPSRFLRDMFYRNGVPAGRIAVCDYGTAPPPAEFGALLAARPPHVPVRFGYLGSLMAHKGVHVLIDAFNRLSPGQAELHVFGAAPDAAYEDALRRRAGDGVRWRGPLAHVERWRALGEVDVIVVPSVWHENSPLTIHEALTARVPVIGSTMGGIPELIRHGETGLVYPAQNADALAACLQQVAADPSCISRWQERITPPQSMDAHAVEIEAIYRELCAHRANA